MVPADRGSAAQSHSLSSTESEQSTLVNDDLLAPQQVPNAAPPPHSSASFPHDLQTLADQLVGVRLRRENFRLNASELSSDSERLNETDHALSSSRMSSTPTSKVRGRKGGVIWLERGTVPQ